MRRAFFSPCTLTLTLSRRGRGDAALPLRPGHPLRSLRSAKGTELSEPQITRIALMGYDFRGLVDGFIEVNVLSESGYVYSELTGAVIGCAIEVHSILGTGFQEVVYQRALAVEMEKRGLSFAREWEVPIFYKQRQVGTRRVDFLVDGKVVVELKAISGLENVHLAQAINYLEAFGLEVGLLLNFGAGKLEFRRVVNSVDRGLG